MEESLDIGINHRVPILEIAFIFFIKSEGQSGIIDQHINLVPGIGERLYGISGSFAVAHIERQGQHLYARLGQCFPHLVQLVGVSSVNDEVIARCGKLLGASLPDAACGAGNKSNFFHGDGLI